jgi:hypothetical protein
MLQYVPSWDNDCEGGKWSLPPVMYVGKDKEKSNDSPDSVADGFGPSLPDEPELTASKEFDTLRQDHFVRRGGDVTTDGKQ